MASLFDPAADDNRLHAPATARNQDVILEVLQAHIKDSGVIFEVAAGTGEHSLHFAPSFPNAQWQPTDIDPSHLLSIDAWRNHANIQNILPAMYFNVLDDAFPHDNLNAILAINLIHISPLNVTKELMKKAGESLPPKGILFFYGPYKKDGMHTSDSNANFDLSLKSRNSEWGIRDMEQVIELAEVSGFKILEIKAMPANNFSPVFGKQ